jgi:hypothetical protein
MNPEEPKEPEIEIKEKTVNIPFPETFTYANCAAFSLSLMEFRIGFAEFATLTGDGPTTAIPRVGIVMPPEAAAVIALMLMSQLHSYEKSFGEIRHPAWRAAKAQQQIPQVGTSEPEQSV